MERVTEDFGDRDRDVRRLAALSVPRGDPTGWFERLYAEAAEGAAVVPWDGGVPQRLLVEWASVHQVRGAGQPAIVVGCGYGDDAEFVAGLGFETEAFDIAASAIDGARRRFPDSRVRYRTADLLRAPASWRRAFQLVVEIYTLQALPRQFRSDAAAALRDLVAPGGTLLVIAHRGEGAPNGSAPPWPLTDADLAALATDGIEPVRVERLDDGRRVRAEFHRHR
jgi:hypothetical protein